MDCPIALSWGQSWGASHRHTEVAKVGKHAGGRANSKQENGSLRRPPKKEKRKASNN